jgi:hypothetical protein
VPGLKCYQRSRSVPPQPQAARVSRPECSHQQLNQVARTGSREGWHPGECNRDWGGRHGQLGEQHDSRCSTRPPRVQLSFGRRGAFPHLRGAYTRGPRGYCQGNRGDRCVSQLGPEWRLYVFGSSGIVAASTSAVTIRKECQFNHPISLIWQHANMSICCHREKLTEQGRAQLLLQADGRPTSIRIDGRTRWNWVLQYNKVVILVVRSEPRAGPPGRVPRPVAAGYGVCGETIGRCLRTHPGRSGER